MTHRLVLMLIEQLPPQSRTKTAERDELDPFDLAETLNDGAPRRGWGPHDRKDELLMQLGERLDQIAYLIVKTTPGATGAKEPGRWRRPGVLGAADLAVIDEIVSEPVVASLEAERAERARRRAEQRATQQQGGGTA